MNEYQKQVVQAYSPEIKQRFTEFCFMLSLYKQSEILEQIEKQKQEEQNHSDCLDAAYGTTGQG